MYGKVREQLAGELAAIDEAGLTKGERVITTPQGAHVEVAGRRVLNLCANNYLGLADHPDVVAAAHRALDDHGFGMASVRFICGTQDLHTQLEAALSEFLGTDATILYGSCFDANGGLFETLLGPDDAVISDALNHASIIDGIRLSRATRLRYANSDMADLEARLVESAGARRRLVVTDGVFSMDGYLASLPDICDLAERHDALVMVDDSHAVGFLGPGGRGTPALHGLADRVDIVTGTLGKALGGASGGYTSGRAEIIALLRQRSRPYLFSNSIPPAVAGASLAALRLLEGSADLRERLAGNTAFFRERMVAAGFAILPGDHPIVPVMFGDAHRAAAFSQGLLDEGVYAVAFSYPVVPEGQARIRVQLSAAHSREDLQEAIDAFVRVSRRLAP
ncbi:MAG: glycine C-acetyltransferase [Actinomycetota bacterium]|nr:glycine C-acetyltransferase [Actinomycetota bacterium]